MFLDRCTRWIKSYLRKQSFDEDFSWILYILHINSYVCTTMVPRLKQVPLRYGADFEELFKFYGSSNMNDFWVCSWNVWCVCNGKSIELWKVFFVCEEKFYHFVQVFKSIPVCLCLQPTWGRHRPSDHPTGYVMVGQPGCDVHGLGWPHSRSCYAHAHWPIG